MVATNSVAARTGNVSAGTSVFAMIVLENPLSQVYPEIDMVTTPSGKPVAMVHSNNCTTDLNAWVDLFGEFAGLLGVEVSQSKLFELLYRQGLGGDAEGGGLLAYNYYSGEHITHMTEGRPLFVRTPESNFTLANFMRVHLFSSLGALKIGLGIFDKEQVKIDRILGHGGFFKTPEVGQKIMAAAMNVPVSVMETAGEGGAWGIALLAAYIPAQGRRPDPGRLSRRQSLRRRRRHHHRARTRATSTASTPSWSATRRGWSSSAPRWRGCGRQGRKGST